MIPPVRKRILLLVGIAILAVFGGYEILKSKPLLKNGALSKNFDGWESTAGIAIFRDPTPRNWQYYWMLVRTGGIFHLGDIRNDRFAAIGAGNARDSVLWQNVALDGRGGRYELSFLFAATGDAGTTALLQTSVTDTNGRVLLGEMLTNTQPVKNYYVPRKQERLVRFSFDVPAGTASVKLSFADQSPNGGVAVDPLIKNVSLRKVR